MMPLSESDTNLYPLASYFLSGYLAKRDDPTNFPHDDLPNILGRYQILFTNALEALGLTKEQLRARTEFNFDSGNAANLEGGIAILRTVEALRLQGFTDLALIAPRKGEQGADITVTRAGVRVCVEVKAVTKQSHGKSDLFLEDQLYEKVREHAEKASR
jgi:hypothetical protein